MSFIRAQPLAGLTGRGLRVEKTPDLPREDTQLDQFDQGRNAVTWYSERLLRCARAYANDEPKSLSVAETLPVIARSLRRSNLKEL